MKKEKAAEYEQSIRAKHPEARAHVVNVDGDGNERHLWLKEPHRMALGVFLAKKSEDFVSACEVLFDSCAIPGVSDVDYFRNNNEVFYGIMGDLVRLVPLKKSSLTIFY